jgi:hypothetical protein
MSDSAPSLLSVTVSGGAGSATIRINGTGCAIGIKPPALAVYDCEITDADGFGLAGGTTLNGLVKIDSFFQVFGVVTVSISAATVDGTYQIKFWYL